MIAASKNEAPMPIRAILTDIEGTTSSISFVKDVLFPYARRALPRFVAIRFFTEPDGWVGHFTGTDIAQRFPRYEVGQARE